jgi:hypothetical protein
VTLVFKDALITFNSVDVSDFATSVTLPIEFEELEDTAFGDNAHSRIAGLQDSTISIDWNQSFAASEVDATIWAAIGTVVTIKVRPTSASISATNPEYSGTYLISKYNPFGNKVGELATVSSSWPLSSSALIARATS